MRRAGFTLLEMVVVLLIVVVSLAVAVPAFLPPAEPEDLATATARLSALFRLARDSAVRSGRPVTVFMDSASNHVWLVAGGPFASPGPVAEVAVLPQVRSSLLPEGVPDVGEPLDLPPTVELQLSRTRARFAFVPSGAVFADSIVLRGAREQRLLTLDPWTGDVVY